MNMNTRFENYLYSLTPAKRMLAKEAVQEYLHGESEDVEKLISSDAIYKKMKFLSVESEEKSYVILTKQNFRVLDVVKIADGCVTGTFFDVRSVMREALIRNATCIIMVHNHPSGSINPSREDREITKAVAQAAQIMKLHLIDHVIIGNGDYYSFHDNGLL